MLRDRNGKRDAATGFTLAEILIVLMVIGIIATMTIPGLMKGVQEAQYKTAYKKAYNNIVNLCAMASVNGNLPVRANHNSAGSEYTQIFSTLAKNLSVKGFIYEAIGSGKLNNLSQIKSGLRYFEVAGVNEPSFVGSTDSNNYLDLAAVTSEKATWIVTEDNMAYTVVSYQNTSNKICESKLEINSHITSPEEVKKHVCFTVVVDVNGLNKSPNVVEPQITKTLAASDTLDTLTGDQYYIFIGRDGATAGNPKFTATGRLVGDVK